MPTPLQEKTYEMLIRMASIPSAYPTAEREMVLLRRMFADALEAGAALEMALGAADRTEFRRFLFGTLHRIRLVKLWMQILDDLGALDPDTVHPLSETAEETHKLVLAAIRTTHKACTVEDYQTAQAV
ncbi:MAG: hypothetical protein D8M52_03765 [Chlorobi bacterium]|nr:MAG: hypothetical protein F9K28_05235 [Bacteroidota bacterium]KXK34523.1 MAG: hypothetical protein UZ06_CHB003000986 [Chlorobi bacterium OLB6]MBE2264818.1 hypothetical protein [Flavobacteriales bacterium]MBL1160819.1 hypothetical protein [Chlorobiota bacterium]MBW7852783.1 hypothetical protein [Candidatus Kapabacteria bacterium]MCC6330978.1 hypothetical protein [Ignavibacteria bacterium]